MLVKNSLDEIKEKTQQKNLKLSLLLNSYTI